MESPATIVKTAVQPNSIIKWVVVGLVGFALADLLGVTDYILRPVTMLRAKFARPTS